MNTSIHTGWVPSADGFDVRLALVRHKMGWNLKEAADACGIAPGSWRDWELSDRRPRDFETVCRQIVERTGCNLVWLMTGDGPSIPEPPPGHQATVVRLPVMPRAEEEIDDDARRYVALAEGEANLAPLPGLEPGIYRLTAERSARLSYGGPTATLQYLRAVA